jgi:MazG family protein
LEEVSELDHALSSDDLPAIREEVADLLLHLAWQLVLAEENREFSARDVADDLESKMRRRHPHLFDLGPKEEWEALKRRESGKGPSGNGVLRGLPPSLPSLLMAYRLQERAATVGFDWPDTQGPIAKVREELGEVEAALVADDGDETSPSGVSALVEEIGDLLFAVVNLARKARVQPLTALDHANRKFRRRFETMERLAAARGIDVPSAGLEALDRLWEEAKLGEKAS